MMMKIWRMIIFPTNYRIAMGVVNSMEPDNPYTYPMIVYVTFNKNEMRHKFVDLNKPMIDILSSKVKILHTANMRHIKRKMRGMDDEVMERAYKLKRFIETGREIKEYFPQVNLN